MFKQNKNTSNSATAYECINYVARSPNKMADMKTLRNNQTKREKMNLFLIFTQIFLFTFFVWTLQCAYNDHSNGSAVSFVTNRSLAENNEREKSERKREAKRTQDENEEGSQSSRSSQNFDLNIKDIERKFNDFKNAVKEKVENAVNWDGISENVKQYLVKLDSSMESRIKEEAERANTETNLTQNADVRTQLINSYVQNYSIITPPILLMIFTILTSENFKKHVSNILLTALFVVVTYIFFKLKKIEENKNEKNDTDNTPKFQQ
ncbi:hypothetical protein MKS88_005248 [Plasmodium brasilianum]|uniref:EMP1-trafficking protein n=2 Tax=Plasmodium (Plasmodium) TaxID=418103 RepID=A0A1A8WVY7_PLAMA|nr:Plasmodium exported protein, unknown function [Plasmodium malariae]KAI4834574.1 hypothetical protein MKS88_005248 [Plasmodium brasilianum]SBS96037.1 Plasmodium exported protein, unknown function [Plasmodium malariae]SCP03110.1 Plasmodium exported protein, unknown function [Plasmodium malariae]